MLLILDASKLVVPFPFFLDLKDRAPSVSSFFLFCTISVLCFFSAMMRHYTTSVIPVLGPRGERFTHANALLPNADINNTEPTNFSPPFPQI